MSKGIGIKRKGLNTQQKAMTDVNRDWCRKEKLFRMHAGCASEPLRYRNGIVEIKIRFSQRVSESEEFKRNNVIHGLMRNWINAFPEAKGYRAYICKSALPAGFSTPASQVVKSNGDPDKDAVSQLANAIRHIMSTEPVDTFIEKREWPSGTKF